VADVGAPSFSIHHSAFSIPPSPDYHVAVVGSIPIAVTLPRSSDMGIFKEFRDFAVRGNVIDMAVGIIIGGAFGVIVKSLVDDVIMPPIGYLTGGVDFADKKVTLADPRYLVEGSFVSQAEHAAAVAAGLPAKVLPAVTIGWGAFVNATLTFVIVAFAVFLLVKAVNKARAMAEREKEAAPPPSAPPQELLLAEIRDLLKARG